MIVRILVTMGGRRSGRPRRPSLAQAVRAVGKADWAKRLVSGLIACFAAVYALFGVWAVHDGWDGLTAVTVGVPGTVAIRQCAESTSTRDPQFWTSGWSCTGEFIASDGSIRIDSVRLFLHGDSRPGPVVTGRVSGPGATWVWPDGEIEWLVAVLFAVSAPFAVWLVMRWAVDVFEPLGGWPPRPRPRSGSDRAVARLPQMGNRARRRRRRRR